MRAIELFENIDVPDIGYHGTIKSNRGKIEFDEKRIHPTDQFLGRGFYFSIDKKIAEEYAHIRAIQFGKNLSKGDPRNKGGEGYFFTLDHKNVVSTSSVLAGTDINGNPIRNGQELLTVDLSEINNTWFINDNADRLKAIDNAEELKKQGYDSIAFKDFSDRSKQIMVFPEYINKVKILKREPI